MTSWSADGRRSTTARRALSIRYAPDSFAPFPDLTVNEMFKGAAALKRSPRPDPALLERFGVSPFLHQGVTRLSAGQTRRAALVAALIGDPWLLVLDEPTTGLDVDGVALLITLLGEREQAGMAAIMVAHDASLAQAVSARTYDLVDGSLLAVSSRAPARPDRGPVRLLERAARKATAWRAPGGGMTVAIIPDVNLRMTITNSQP